MPASDDLKAAAEWLAKRHAAYREPCAHLWNAHHQCQWCHRIRDDVCSEMLADAYLASLAAEEAREKERALPVTPGRLLAIGFSRTTTPSDVVSRPYIMTRTREMLVCRGDVMWVGQTPIAITETMGQVLGLLAALGVPTKGVDL